MRFTENGPSIPDSLLTARDEGRVVFFCGAGVSRARVELSGFFGLARKVVQALGVSETDQAWRLLDEAEALQNRTGYTISADRIFGLLERDFPVQEIEHQIAVALKPPDNPDLFAHRTMIDLATTQEGRVHLVTTNFDRLFEDCAPHLHVWHPSRLPNLARGEALNGIVHLHGIANADYSGADNDPFVLSSSQFGRAYLSDGWATKFIRTVLSRYVVVFVGYAADDPPVQYLLEALTIGEAQNHAIFAFQSNADSDAKHRWRQKGATPIEYDEVPGHSLLWDTLGAWAIRAENPDAWLDAVIQNSLKGPSKLAPYERGQVAHLVSTVAGSRRLAETMTPLPAEWLCVLDPYIRYAKPGKIGSDGPIFDPFSAYGLDTDEVPQVIDPDNHYVKRETPTSAWDAFASTASDSQTTDPRHLSVLRGHLTHRAPEMPRRLSHLGTWISRVADQPSCVWWAIQQGGLHPGIRSRISHMLSHELKHTQSALRDCWHYLFEAWENTHTDFGGEWFSLKAKVKHAGWSSPSVREAIELARPRLKVEKSWSSGPKPPADEGEFSLRDIARVDVEYPSRADEVRFPDEWLIQAIRGFRQNLILAVQMETEHHDYGVRMMGSIVKEVDFPNDGGQRDRHDRTHGLLGYVLYFVDMFDRLITHDLDAARAEMRAWPTDDDYVFDRLRIWAAGKPDVVSTREAASIFLNLSDEAFWDGYHQRDLLLSLKTRWAGLDRETTQAIERRLLNGRSLWLNEDDDEGFQRDRATRSLGRLYWLRDQGCDFSFDLEEEATKLKRSATDWKPEYARGADTELGVIVSWGSTDDSDDVLKGVPLRDVLDVAAANSGRGQEMFVERDPFAGLVSNEPFRAYSALTVYARRGEYPDWAWRTFLNDEARRKDVPRLANMIAQRMIRCSPHDLAKFPYAIFEWFLRLGDMLSREYPATFDQLFYHLATAIEENPDQPASSLMRRSDAVDWVAEAINAPGGKLAESLMEDCRRELGNNGNGFSSEWLSKWERLLRLPNDHHCYAITIGAFNLHWFFGHDRKWTETNFLRHLGTESAENDALLCGFLWNSRAPFGELYEFLKDTISSKAASASFERRGYREHLAALVMVGWGIAKTTDQKPIYDDGEFRKILLEADDDFRATVLWLFERWSSDTKPADNPWPELLVPFLQRVWPRHKRAKTPRTTMRLCNIAFASSERFPELADIILPLVSVVNDDRLFLYELRDEGNDIVAQHPERVLDVIFAVLPEDAGLWPHGLDETLDDLCNADEKLRANPKMIELRRRWNSR